MSKLHLVAIFLIAGTALIGCSNQKIIAQKDHEIDVRDQRIADLERQIANLEQEVGTANQLNEDLKRSLGTLQEKEKLSLSTDRDRAMITMPDAVTFASGSANLTTEGKSIIDKVWEVLNRYPDRKILVEGHTDDVPIAPQYQHRFRSNWELSAARALAVVHYVRGNFEADPTRLSAVGCGEHQPVADNSTEEGRSKNRRVVIVVAKPSGHMAQNN